MARGKLFIYGKHALLEALIGAPQAIQRVYLAEEFRDADVMRALSRAGIRVDRMRPREIDRTVGKDTVHQGVIVAINPDALLRPFRDFIDATAHDENTSLVLLDGLTDPHNVGAVIRSAAAFGASGVLLPSRRQSPITGAVAKVSAGMIFRVPIVSVGGTSAAINDLQRAGFKVYALTADGRSDVRREPFDGPSVFIIGNEAEGISSKTAELVDATLRIPIHERAESLNAAVSAAVVLYQWSARHNRALSL